MSQCSAPWRSTASPAFFVACASPARSGEVALRSREPPQFSPGMRRRPAVPQGLSDGRSGGMGCGSCSFFLPETAGIP
jgi:hypothetical protein